MATFLFLPRFVINCDLLLNRRTATWKEQKRINDKLASYRFTVGEFVLVYGFSKSQMLGFVRLCSAAWLLLVQSRKIAKTFSKLHRASRSDDTFCEDFFQVSISKATCKRTQPTTPNYIVRGSNFHRFQTLRNNIQQHATGCVNGRNMLVTSNNVAFAYTAPKSPTTLSASVSPFS